jgi:hypothetical protein
MGSSSSTSSSPDGKCGGVYSFKLFFYDKVDEESARQEKDHSMTNDELLEKFGKLKVTGEKILEVRYYTHPLNWWQVSKYNLQHAYIVFETENWWWSIEKNDNCVAIQRSKKIEFVRDKYYRTDRMTALTTGISCIKEKTVDKRTVKELLEHIKSSNYVNQQYHFLEQNCYQMADKIYAIF